jgi:hypothetical protein
MKCTDCSAKIKPVVAIDIDGTLGPFHKHFLDFAAKYLDKRVPYDYDGTESFREHFCERVGVPESKWREIKLAYRQGGMKRTMPVYDFAEPLTRYITGQGAELWLTTSRPAYRLDNIDPDTLEWCRRNRIGFDHLLYDDDKYERLAELVDPARVVAVLDDLPEMYDAAMVRFGPDVPILAKSEWNRGVKRHTQVQVGYLQESCRLMGHRLAGWNRVHDIEATDVPMFPLPKMEY